MSERAALWTTHYSLRCEVSLLACLLIRKTEELLLRLFSQGLLSGTTHTYIGQELCATSVVRALSNPADVVLSNHRNHSISDL